MLPNNIYGLIAFGISAVLILLGFWKAWKWYLDAEVEKQKSKDEAELEKQKSRDAVEIAKYNAEVAKQKADILTAAQVVELMKATSELKQDVTEIKNENENRDIKLAQAMDKFEIKLSNFEDSFQNFLIARVNQFEQILLK